MSTMMTGKLLGMSAHDALAAVRRMAGHQSALVVDDDEIGDAEALASALNENGVSARIVRAGAGDLRYLQPPSLLLLTDGSWLLLKARRQRTLLLEGANGRTAWRRVVRNPAWFQGEALTLDARPEGTSSVWTALAAPFLARRALVIRLIAVMFVVQAATLASPQFTRLVFDRAIPAASGGLLQILVAGLIAVSLFQAWAAWLQGRMLLFFESHCDVSAARVYLERLLQLPFPVVFGRPAGELAQGLRGLTSGRELIMERGIPTLLQSVTAPVFLVIMATRLPAVTLAIAATAAAAIACAIALARRQLVLRERELAAQARQRSFLIEMIAAIATVKAAASEATVIGRWRGLLNDEFACGDERERVALLVEVGLDSLSRLGAVMVLAWGSSYVLAGVLSVGELMAFSQMTAAVFTAVVTGVNAYGAYLSAQPNLHRANAVLMHPLKPRRTKRNGGPSAGSDVVIEDVWFRYEPGARPIFSGVNLRVAAGGCHRIDGESGAGKTTLLRLIAGLYVPERGRIRVDDLDPASDATAVRYLPQNVQLCGGSLLDNLRMFSGGAPKKKLLAVARDIGLDQWVETLPMGYHTILPPGAASISGGQRQMIAIAAALASNASLLLLDEPTAHFDTSLHTRMLAKLSDVASSSGKTVIYTAHAAPGLAPR